MFIALSEILVALAGALLPIVYDLLFGHTPLSSLIRTRQRALENKRRQWPQSGDNKDNLSSGFSSSSSVLDQIELDVARSRVHVLDSHSLLSTLALESSKRAKNVSRRANVFVLTGVFIAISGLFCFYILHKTTPPAKDTATYLISLAPNFGILLFIEYVALFFLKQYRPTIDEFRFFEALARSREDTLVALKIIFERGDTISGQEAVRAANVLSIDNRLGKDESTEIIELRKVHKDDLMLIEMLLDTFKSHKKSS